MAPKHTILVDVDGVIIDGRPQDGAAWATDLKTTFGFDENALNQYFFEPFWADIVIGKDTLLPRLRDALETMGANCTAEDLRDFWFANDVRKNQSVTAWMDRARAQGHRVMLATNQDHSRTEYLLNEVNLKAHCDGAYSSAMLGLRKPDRAFFEAIIAAEQSPATTMIFIDDRAPNVEAALAVGIDAHHYTGQSLDELIP